MAASAAHPAAHPAAPAIGLSLPRVNDTPLLTGRARYVDDLKPAGCLHVALLRSPFAHAEIARIDTSAALSGAGVVGVFTGRDVHPERPFLHTVLAAKDVMSPDRPLLAPDKARFVGEAVAAVVAESRYQAEDALDRILVEWRELPPVLAEGADGEPVHADIPDNRYSRRTATFGDPEAAIADAHLVIDREIVHPRVTGCPLEGRGVLAVPDGGNLRVELSAQSASMVHSALVRVLGLEPDRVNVVIPAVGGGFGLKGHVYPEDILIPWLALRLGRPVKWIEDRAEHLSSANHSRDQRVRLRAGFSADGRLRGLQATVISDGGAYGVHPMGPLLDLMTCSGLIPGPYDLRDFAYDSRALVTNKAPGGAFRGVGMTTAVLAHERLMDIAATELGLDPVEIRLQNLVPGDRMPYTTVTGHPYESGDFSATLQAAAREFDYAAARQEQARGRAEGRLLGIGVCTYIEVTAGGSRTFVARGMTDVQAVDSGRTWLDAEGRIRVQTTSPDIGQGSLTTLSQVAAEGLGVECERVVVEPTDSGCVAVGFGTGMSRSSVATANAVFAAAQALRTGILEAAAWHLDVPPEELEVVAGRVQERARPGHGIDLVQLGSEPPEAHGGLSLDTAHTYDPAQASHPFASHFCLLEVDPRTGRVKILRYVVAEDCGRVINPVIVDGQIIGGVVQGIASALLEEIRYGADGQLLTASFMDYLLPTAMEAPGISIVHSESPSPKNQLGTKGTGEGGTIAAPAAVANGVADALGVEANQLPLTPDRIRSLLNSG